MFYNKSKPQTYTVYVAAKFSTKSKNKNISILVKNRTLSMNRQFGNEQSPGLPICQEVLKYELF